MDRTFHEIPSECIMVCISYGPNAERLIRRGRKIAQSLSAPLYILTVDSKRDREYDEERERQLEEWETLAKSYGAELLAVESQSRKISKVIADVAREKHVTQIVIGQTPKSRWQEMLQGSIINEIMNQIELVDLHIVSVQRELPQLEEEYEKGVRAYLLEENGECSLAFDKPQEACVEGMFFKELHTDFNNGLFKIYQDDKKLMLKVRNGIVEDYKK